MSRRTAALLLALALTVGLLAGCGDREEVSAGDSTFGSLVDSTELAASVVEAVPSEEVSGNGSFSMPYNESYGWDPFSCIGMENRAVMQLIYEGLFTMNTEFEAENVLCSSYTISDDGLTYTLSLQSAVFSNGKTLTADDVVYSMQRAEESDLYSSRFTDISSYYASDMDTVTVTLRNCNDRLPCLLTFPIVPSYSSSVAPPGTGPFVRNGSTLLVNPQWWQGADSLNFQTVNLYASASAEDTRDNFEIDNVHFVYNNPISSTAATFHCDYELWNSRGTVMQYIGFNFTSDIFSNAEARAAITYAIDRSLIAESVYHNFADAAVLPAPPSSTVYDEDLAQEFAYTSALDARNKLLESGVFQLPDSFGTERGEETAEDSTLEDQEQEDAGETEAAASAAPAYNSITLLLQDGNLNRTAAAKLVAQQLEEVGFTVTINAVDADEFAYYLNRLDWDLYYGEVCLKPDFDLRPLLTAGGSLCYGAFTGGSELDGLLYDALENSGNRYDLYERIMERGYLCPVLFLNNAVFTTRGMFTGLDPSPDNLFYHITSIHINGG